MPRTAVLGDGLGAGHPGSVGTVSRRLRARARLGEAPGELPQQVKRERRLRLHQREEVLAGDRQAAHRRGRAHPRDPGSVLDEERELAEEVPGPSSIVSPRSSTATFPSSSTNMPVPRSSASATTWPASASSSAAQQRRRARPTSDMPAKGGTLAACRAPPLVLYQLRRVRSPTSAPGAPLTERKPGRAAAPARAAAAERALPHLDREAADDPRCGRLLEPRGLLDRDARDPGVLQREPAEDRCDAPGLLRLRERRVAQPRGVEQELSTAAAPGRRRPPARGGRAARRRPGRQAR